MQNMSKKQRKSAVWKALFDVNYGVYDYLMRNEFITSDDAFAEAVVLTTRNDWKSWRMGAFAYPPELPVKVRKIKMSNLRIKYKKLKKDYEFFQKSVMFPSVTLNSPVEEYKKLQVFCKLENDRPERETEADKQFIRDTLMQQLADTLRDTIKVDQRPKGFYFNETEYDEYKINVYVKLDDDLKDVGEVEVTNG